MSPGQAKHPPSRRRGRELPSSARVIPAALASGSLWRDRDFRTLWGGQSVSELGSQISVVALPLLAVLVLHADAFAVGVLEAAASVGFLLVSLPAGALVDRWRRRPVLAWTNLARALVLGSIPVAWALGSITLVQLDAVALTAGCLRVFFDVAWQSYLPSLVAPERLVDGNGKLEASAATARVGGPALAGFLVAAVGGANAIAADAASFVVGWGSVVAIRRREPIRTRGAGSATPATRLTSEIADGVRFVVHHDVLRRIVAATATSNFGGGALGAVEIVFAVHTLHASPEVIGALFSVGSLGALAGSLAAGRLARRFGSARIIWLAMLADAPFPFLLALSSPGPGLTLAALAFAGMGFAAVIYNVNQLSYRQRICPPELLGRMNASIRFVVWGVLPLGALAGGGLANLVGTRVTIAIAAAFSAGAAGWLLTSRLRREPDFAEMAQTLPRDPTPSVPAAGRAGAGEPELGKEGEADAR